ncbi:MAG: DUF4159 domain-containing protein [Candidatus Neomarinimicrobiota bacterium]|nr:DUF4159 domain-containing protein [Candidatus Neomarinimicrobiota bacterium]
MFRKNILSKYVVFLTLIQVVCSQDFNIARIHYPGGGDWYADPSSLPNLLGFVSSETNIKVESSEYKIKLTDQDLYKHTYLYITGHGNIRFNDEEIGALRKHLLKGAFLHADDNYGMNNSFRREMRRVFPNKEWVELPIDHPIFNCYYKFPNGLPKIHEHDGKHPQGLGLFEGDRLIVFYSYESDLGDGWEDSEVHNNPEAIRKTALQMGANIIWFALTQ